MFAEFEDDEEDYDAVEETPTVGVAGASAAPQAPGVVVPTVDAVKATAAAVAMNPAPPPAVMVSVPAVAVPSMSTAAVPAVATLAAAVATAKHVAKPRTREERGRILRFTDLSHGAKAKRAAAPAKTHKKRKTASFTHDDVFEDDDEVEDDSDEDEAPGGASRSVSEDSEDSEDSDDSAEADSDADSDGPEMRRVTTAGETIDDDEGTKAAGDGRFAPPRSHVPAEHVDWEDGIAWGSSSDSEEDAPRNPKPPARSAAAAADPAPASNAALAPEAASKPRPKKMVVRFGCKPAAAATGEPRGDAGGGDGSPARPGGGAPTAAAALRQSAKSTSEPRTTRPPNETTSGSAFARGERARALVVTAQTRGWWGDLPETPLDQASVPFTRHAQHTRLWGEHPDDARDDDEDRASADTAVDDTSMLTRVSPRRAVARGIGAGAFGPDGPGDVAFVASQPGAGKALLQRRNQKLCTGEWLDDVSWAPVPFDASERRSRARGDSSHVPPPVRIDPNDPRMVLRWHAPPPSEATSDGEARVNPDRADAQAATRGVAKGPASITPWAGALATIAPGRVLPDVEDLEAFLHISLDGDEDEAGGGGRGPAERDAKKDKGLVGRPGRMDGIYNAGVVAGPPSFAPASHVKHHPKPTPLFVPAPYAHGNKVGLALNLAGKKSAGDDKFFVAVKSLTVESSALKIGVRPFDTVDGLLRRVRKKWPDLQGALEAHFPEGDTHKKHVAACEAAREEGARAPRAPGLDPRATLEQCGIRRRVPEPLVYIVAPECFMLDESRVSEQRPAAVAAAQAALARAMGEETATEAETKTAEEIAAAAAAVAAADPAEATANAMTKPSDLSATNGRIILVQYAEANPPLIAKPGMGAKRVTYYRRRTQGDTSGRSLTQGGKRVVVDLRPEASSPFLGELTPGQPQESLETTTFRAPMFQRRIGSDEGLFLLIRSPHGGFSMREVTEYFVLGQQEPHVEVYQPNTDRCRDFEERAINAAVIFSLVKQRAEKVPEEDMRVKVSDIERQFNRAILDKDIRRRIRRKILLPVRAPGQRRRANDDYYDDDADEFELNPSYRFEDDLMLHRMCPPEDVVAYESMRAALARLQAGRDERGAARIRRLAGTSQTQALQAFQATLRGATPAQREGLSHLELLLALQPWAQTTEFLAAVGGRAVLHLDASRRLRERTGKFYHYVRRQPPKDPEGAAAGPKIKPGTVTGTDADLRKLTMPQTERILTGFGVAMSQIKSLHRWKRIGLIRELSGAATADRNAEHVGLSRFARSLRVGIQQQMTEQREAANKIFDGVRRLLQDKRQRGLRAFQRSSDGGSSDDSDDSDDDSNDDDSDESESEPDSLADELEGAMDEDTKGKAPDEEEERRELEEMRAMMDDGAGAGGAAGPTPEKVGPTTVPPGKKLVLKRVVTKTYPDGRVEKIEDDVAADVGDAWMKHRAFKPDGSVDIDASREAVMKILYPHGVDPPAYVAGGSVGGGGGVGAAAAVDASIRTIKAPNFQGTADQKADLLRLRKRKMELLRRRKKKAEQLRAEAGVSQQDLVAMAEKAEKAETESEGGAPKKLKVALSFKLGGAAGGGAGQSRFAPKEEAQKLTKPTTSRFRTTSSRDDVLCQITEGLASAPAYAAFAAPVTKKALPDYHKFVPRKMDLGLIARNAKRAGGYESVDAWMRDVRQILENARLYHEADEDVLIRVPAIVHSAEQLVRDAETALEARAADIKSFDPAFDLEKALGKTTTP